jgi:large subunit ribosomal protein L32
MAVPKKKTSQSKKKMRRSHLALKKVNFVIDKESGEFKLPHHICDGKYKGMQIVDVKVKKEEESVEA